MNECRCGLIEQQTILCSSEIIDAEKIISSLLMILHNIPKQAAKSASLVYGVKCEVEGWCNIMKTYFSFQKYRYVTFACIVNRGYDFVLPKLVLTQQNVCVLTKIIL